MLATSSALLRLHPGVEACEGLIVSDSPENWADWIMGRKKPTKSSTGEPLRYMDRDFIYSKALGDEKSTVNT